MKEYKSKGKRGEEFLTEMEIAYYNLEGLVVIDESGETCDMYPATVTKFFQIYDMLDAMNKDKFINLRAGVMLEVIRNICDVCKIDYETFYMENRFVVVDTSVGGFPD